MSYRTISEWLETVARFALGSALALAVGDAVIRALLSWFLSSSAAIATTVR